MEKLSTVIAAVYGGMLAIILIAVALGAPWGLLVAWGIAFAASFGLVRLFERMDR